MITLQQFSALAPEKRQEYVGDVIANWRVLQQALRRYDNAVTQEEKSALVAQLPNWYTKFTAIDNRYTS